jgi:hypothetical protein
MIAGQSGNTSENPNERIWGCDAPETARVALIGPNGTDLPGVYPCFDYKTMADLLDAKNISWRYYAPGDKSDFFVISAFQAIYHIRFGSDWNTNVISPETKVLTDIQEGKLAQVTWIVPSFAHSDHPGSTNEGPDWVASITNAIGASKFWDSTAIFITWDDWVAGTITSIHPRSTRWDWVSVSRSWSSLLTPAEAISRTKFTNRAASSPTSRSSLTSRASESVMFSPTIFQIASITLSLLSPTSRFTLATTPEFLIREKASGPPDDD